MHIILFNSILISLYKVCGKLMCSDNMNATAYKKWFKLSSTIMWFSIK